MTGPDNNLPVLKLRKNRERSIVNRHPWVFSGAVDGTPKASEGDIVSVHAFTGEFLAYGFYSSRSQITCRLFEWEQDQQVESLEYWKNKISRALVLRKNLFSDAATDCYRLLHAEGDFFPGIIADVYGEVVVLQLLIKAVEQRRELIVEALNSLGFKNIYFKTKTSSQALEAVETTSSWISGGAEMPVQVKEYGLKFLVDVEGGQKTGFFLDQRENRQLLRNLSQGKTVLNAFSYTGGFSVYAVAGGAKEVHSLDISASAVEMAEKNVDINFSGANHKGITADCFDYLKDMPADLYDLIVLDPPAFAKHARAVDNASRGYKQINLRAFNKIRKNGILFTFSCSQNIEPDLFRKIVFSAAADAGRNVRIIHQLHQPFDHPVNIYHPEGEYLKGLVLWVE